MSNYSPAEIEAAQLKLIDAIPGTEEPRSCHPLENHILCEVAWVPDAGSVANEVVVWPGVSRNLLDGYDGMPHFDGSEDGDGHWTTDEERAVGDCILRRALGMRPLYEVSND